MLLNASLLAAAVYIGIQGLFVAGVHTDTGGAQRGVAPGALIEVGAESGRIGFRAEGIPPISLPQAPSAFYGAAIPQLSLINGAVRYAVNPAATLWAGAGETIINQRTPLPNLSQVVGSRLAGVRYEMMYRKPLSGDHFVELLAGGAPRLTGSDIFIYSIPHPAVGKPEVASEVDGQIAWGVHTRTGEFLFGLRSINFSARFAVTGEAADRNNGGGAMVEWRRFFGR